MNGCIFWFNWTCIILNTKTCLVLHSLTKIMWVLISFVCWMVLKLTSVIMLLSFLKQRHETWSKLEWFVLVLFVLMSSLSETLFAITKHFELKKFSCVWNILFTWVFSQLITFKFKLTRLIRFSIAEYDLSNWVLTTLIETYFWKIINI